MEAGEHAEQRLVVWSATDTLGAAATHTTAVLSTSPHLHACSALSSLPLIDSPVGELLAELQSCTQNSTLARRRYACRVGCACAGRDVIQQQRERTGAAAVQLRHLEQHVGVPALLPACLSMREKGSATAATQRDQLIHSSPSPTSACSDAAVSDGSPECPLHLYSTTGMVLAAGY